MITFNQLKEADPSIRVYPENIAPTKFKTLCSSENICDDGIIFIKNKKYYDQIKDKINHSKPISNLCLVLEKSFLDSDAILLKKEILNCFKYFLTVESVDLAITFFSKLFYHSKIQNKNDLIDGRDLQSAKIHKNCSIAENVFVGNNVEIAQGVVIHSGCVIMSNSKINENSVIYPNVVLCRNVTIGRNCIIHANTTIGSDGFSYTFFKGEHLKVWHLGGVVVEDNVEIGSNTSIDQGTFSATIIGQGSKIDNQVHIAHNCKLGKGVIVCGQIGMAGSVTIGDYVVMAGAANIAPKVTIADCAQIGGMAGVTNDVPKKEIFAGHPARPIKQWLKGCATINKLSKQKKS